MICRISTMWLGGVFFFKFQLTVFATMWKRLQPEGASCSSAWWTDGKAERWWLPGRREESSKEKKKERKKLTYWDSHRDPAERSTNTDDPSESSRSVCVCVTKCALVAVEPCLSACSCQSCLHALVCVWWGKPSLLDVARTCKRKCCAFPALITF